MMRLGTKCRVGCGLKGMVRVRFRVTVGTTVRVWGCGYGTCLSK